MPQAAAITLRYGLAVALTVLAVLGRLALDPWLGDTARFLLFIPAVMLTAWLAGRGPALVSIALAAIALLSMFIDAHALLSGGPSGDTVSLALFVLIALLVATLTIRFREARAAAQLASEREGQARLRAEETLRRYERLLLVRDTFASMLAHELRTPLTVILGDARLLTRASPPPPAVARELLVDIGAEAERLHLLVEDLLILNRDQDELESSRQPVSLEPLLRQIIDSEIRDLRTQRVELKITRPLPLVSADPSYLRQLIGNLISNARKYGGDLPIEVSAEGDADTARVRVADRGPGIPPGDEERIFDLFYRSPITSATRSGAGIGLYVCRRLAAAMDGRVWSEQREGGGSVFVVQLPRYCDEEARSEAQDDEDAVQVRPMVAAEVRRAEALAGAAAEGSSSRTVEGVGRTIRSSEG